MRYALFVAVLEKGVRVATRKTGPMASSSIPHGYEEAGKTLAQPVVEGFRSMYWARHVATILGYSAADVQEWIDYYRKINKRQIERAERRKQRKHEKIEALRSQAEELLKNHPDPMA